MCIGRKMCKLRCLQLYDYLVYYIDCLYIFCFSSKAAGKWNLCLACTKPMIFFSSCGLQKVGCWVALWSEIQRPHRPFLKSA